MTDKVVIVIAAGLDNPNRSTRGIHLATVAQKKGKDVKVFLLDDAVFVAKEGLAENLYAATGDSAADLLLHLQEFEVPILACTPCAQARKITQDDLIEGARLATAAELIDLTTDHAVISL
ncbi:MAG: DsrE family protein [Thermodesulfobacteriota bacterium]